MTELATEDLKEYMTILRMTPENFFDLLELVSEKLTRNDTFMRDSLTPQIKFEATLYFLATGNSYTSVSYTHLDVYKRQILSNCDDLSETIVLDDIILNNSGAGTLVRIETSEEVEFEDDACERECKVRLRESEMQSTIFPSDLSGVRSSHVVIRGMGFSGFPIDKVTQSSPKEDFCVLPGKARMCNSEFFVPSVRNEVVQGDWNAFCDEWQRSVVVKIFNINRVYENLISDIEVLGEERLSHID